MLCYKMLNTFGFAKGQKGTFTHEELTFEQNNLISDFFIFIFFSDYVALFLIILSDLIQKYFKIETV